LTILVESRTDEPAKPPSILSTMSILNLTLVMLLIGIVWRVVDVFVLDLGATWLNILPSKLGPLVIILVVMWRYRRHEIPTVLGLSREYAKPLVVSGVLVALSVFMIVVVGSPVVYSLLLNPEYPLAFNVIQPGLLWYSMIFFAANGVFEEVLFRGMLQNSLRAKMAAGRAIVASALVFGVWHACWPLINGAPVSEWASMIVLSGLLGCMFGVYYEKFSLRTSLLGAITAHTFINFFNENIKIGPAESVQGPDFTFDDPALTGLMAVFFLLLLAFYLIVFSKRSVRDLDRALRTAMGRVQSGLRFHRA